MRLVGCGVDKDNNGGGIKGGIEVWRIRIVSGGHEELLSLPTPAFDESDSSLPISHSPFLFKSPVLNSNKSNN